MNLASLLIYGSAACSAALSAAVLLRARRAVADWAFIASMGILSAISICNGGAASADNPGTAIYWQQWTVLALSFLPGVWLLFSLSYARGNAREFLTKWRVLLLVAFFLPVAVATFFHSHLISLRNTGESSWLLHLGWAGRASYIFVLTGSVLTLMNLERTFRASVGTMRWRIKFTLLGMGVLCVARVYTSSQALLFHGSDPTLESLNAAAMLVATPLLLRSFFRGGQFDTHVYPSQSVLQGSLTVLLAGIYLLAVGALAKVVEYFGGGGTFALKAFVILIALVLLAVLLQSDRVRLRLKRFVSRNFQRPYYDYQLVWRTFTEGTASRVDQTDLCRSLVKMVADMFQVLSVSIWIVDEKGETFTLAGSTSLSESEARQEGPQGTEGRMLISYFQNHHDATDFESETQYWAVILRRMHPSQFPNGGHRVTIPLVGRGEVLGLIALGDRVSGIPFSLQDFDMVKCVADHATASLLNVQLSQKLLQAKELEAFQTMAAFFVHDLKNAASTLNLMLRNLPVHFDDPEFRADALRGIGKTVTHINRLISRLSLLRHELKVDFTESDLNEVVTQAVAGLENSPAAQLAKDLKPLPKIALDRDQIQKVITNLVLNALEALPTQDGKVRILTGQENGWVVLTVSDNGSGMSADFMAHSLFRPFQTTKKNGLGIGMFQSKMIVEAHGGRIAVSSEPGKGTTFQVLLRAKAEIR